MAYDKIVDSAALDGALSVIADAIREKTGSTEKLTLDGMAAAIGGIQVGGSEADHSMEDGLVEGTVEEYQNSRVTKIKSELFVRNRAIRKVVFDAAISCGEAAFRECNNLTTAIFPSMLTSGRDMFYNSKSLNNVSMPNVKTLSMYTFQNCSSLKFLDFNRLETILGQVFDGCGIETLIIRTNKVCTLADTTMKSQVTVYVPQALIESYKTATNWSALYAAGTCSFAAIEGSEYE